MKKMMFTLIAMLTIAVQANAMSYEQARNEALFLTDKMAYELNLSDAQYEAAYEINLDYLMGVTSQYDVFGPYWDRRNMDLSYILFSWQWDMFRAAAYFYRPLVWDAGYWHFAVYARYPHRDYFYFGRPHFYATYRGGHSWHMNHNRSYYEPRRDQYRPGNGPRDQHVGMRNRWDHGDYRNNGQPGGQRRSSTSVTAGGDRDHGNTRPDNGGNRRDNGSARPNTTGSRRDNGSTSPANTGSRRDNSSARPATTGSRRDNSSARPANTGSNRNVNVTRQQPARSQVQQRTSAPSRREGASSSPARSQQRSGAASTSSRSSSSRGSRR